jgi:hypothetical protein
MIVWSFMWSKSQIEMMCIVIDGAFYDGGSLR